jgi:hypothetical protein
MRGHDSCHTPRRGEKAAHLTHHGITVADDYAWLRDPGYPEVTDKEVLAHLEAENAWFEARMAARQGLIDALFREMRARIKEADKSVPQKDGDYLYWIEFEEGAEYKKWWRRPVAGGPDELILDEVALAEGHEYFRLGAISVSNDGHAARLVGGRQRLGTLHRADQGTWPPAKCWRTKFPARCPAWSGSRAIRAWSTPSPTSSGAPTTRGCTGWAALWKRTSSFTTRMTRASASAPRSRPTRNG